MKPITPIILALLVVVVALAVVARTIGIGGGDGDSNKTGDTDSVDVGRVSRQGTPTATFVPPTRSPTPPRPTLVRSERPTVRLSDEGFESQKLNNAIARFVIEHGFGYPTETVTTTAEGMQDLIESGEIDRELEGWQHNRLEWYDEAIRNQRIENLGHDL